MAGWGSDLDQAGQAVHLAVVEAGQPNSATTVNFIFIFMMKSTKFKFIYHPITFVDKKVKQMKKIVIDERDDDIKISNFSLHAQIAR